LQHNTVCEFDIGGRKSASMTIGQWPTPPSNGTLVMGGSSPFANDRIGGWAGTGRSSSRAAPKSEIPEQFYTGRKRQCTQQFLLYDSCGPPHGTHFESLLDIRYDALLEHIWRMVTPCVLVLVICSIA
jgi:hypothetical protein